ncbi:MAG: hypothetical protein ACOZF0_24405 [Thermodesulfobacteriota bacterium]
MTTWRTNPFLWIGIIGTLTIGTSFITDVARAYRDDPGFYWTHQDMKLPLAETGKQFELFIGGVPLQKRLSDSTLFAADTDGKQFPVVARDIGVRLNLWERARASILLHTTISGFASGVSLTLLITGLIQVLRHGKNRNPRE